MATFAVDASGDLAWQGVKWTQPGSSGVQYENTVFTPADTDGDGITDLLYSTSANWGHPGFSMAEVHNNGSGTFTWAGAKWSPSDLKLQDVRFTSPGLTYGGQQWDQTGLTMDMTSFLPQF